MAALTHPNHPLRNAFALATAFADVWLARKLNRPPRRLPILVMMVTDKCNLKCKMCGACDYSPGDHNMLNTRQWLEVVHSAAALGTRIISITGGEAMLRRDLFEIIACARSHGMAVHLNTNGLLLNEKNVQKIAELGVESVSISLESPESAVHEAIRGPGTFERTLQGLRRLRGGAPRVRLGLNCVVNRHNLRGLRELVALGAREGADQVKFAPIHSNLQHKDKPVGDYVDMLFSRDDMPELESEITAIRSSLAATNLQSTSDRFFQGFTRLYLQPGSNFYCYAGYAICVIDAQGNVAACFDKAGARNVREEPLERIWRSQQFQEHRQLVRNCKSSCWDTTNAELSLRLSPWQFVRAPRQSLRGAWFYLRGRNARGAEQV